MGKIMNRNKYSYLSNENYIHLMYILKNIYYEHDHGILWLNSLALSGQVNDFQYKDIYNAIEWAYEDC